MTELTKALRALGAAFDEMMRHPLVALRDWWEEGTGKYDYPPRRYTGGRKP